MKNRKKLQTLVQNYNNIIPFCEDDDAKKGALSLLLSDIQGLVFEEKLEFLKELKPFLTEDAYKINRKILLKLWCGTTPDKAIDWEE